MTVEINNLTKVKADEDFLKRVAEKVLARRQFDLSIALVDEKRIKELNKIYRKKNQPTDVLSFSYDAGGEIVLCPKQIKGEIGRVLIHGILHLLGYDHEKNKKEAQRMQKREKYYLSKI